MYYQGPILDLSLCSYRVRVSGSLSVLLGTHPLWVCICTVGDPPSRVFVLPSSLGPYVYFLGPILLGLSLCCHEPIHSVSLSVPFGTHPFSVLLGTHSLGSLPVLLRTHPFGSLCVLSGTHPGPFSVLLQSQSLWVLICTVRDPSSLGPYLYCWGPTLSGLCTAFLSYVCVLFWNPSS